MMVRKKAASAASAKRKGTDFRVGIILVAYNAERTINAVLDRIPETFWDRCAGVWLSDDGSGDATHKMAVEWRLRHPTLPLTIVRQPVNLGYGGNQKAGYHWAIDNQLDCVVLLHGDGQYAPEIIEDIIAPIERGEAKAVLGSRLMTRGGARRGGMPLYKFVGNRILTTFQNWITGIHLAEWHSGYRAYAVDVLKKIDFNGNSDGFDFDTEILLQVLSAGGHIAEVPIPTYYGEEVSYVNGMKYAKDVVIDSIAWRLQKKGFGAGHLASVGTDYAMRDAATSSHQAIISRLSQEGPYRILDVGCAAGWTSEVLAERHTVVGVDQFAHPGVSDRMSEFIKADLSKGLPSKVGTGYDVVVAADVLEHLATPEHLLAQFKDVLNPDGYMLVSVPNVGHWYPRLRSLIGTFEYDQRDPRQHPPPVLQPPQLPPPPPDRRLPPQGGDSARISRRGPGARNERRPAVGGAPDPGVREGRPEGVPDVVRLSVPLRAGAPGAVRGGDGGRRDRRRPGREHRPQSRLIRCRRRPRGWERNGGAGIPRR